MASIILRSQISCPHCGHREEEEMPQDSSLWYYKCNGCEQSLAPKRGECCIFCSYGTVVCPPIQEAINDMAGLL